MFGLSRVRFVFARILLQIGALILALPLALGAALAQDTDFSKEELDQILAPIAHYPDDLFSSVPMASTYPLEVVQAARWVKEPAIVKRPRITGTAPDG